MDLHLIRLPDKAQNLLEDPASIDGLIEQFQNDQSRHLNLGEAWAGIHFTLTDEYPIPREEALKRGMSWDDTSLENVLMGGLPTTYQASSVVARYLMPKHVSFLATKLSNISIEQFEEWFDPKWLLENHIRPEIWEQVEVKQWLIKKFSRLKDFYQQAATNNEGVVIYIL
ncbi:MAG TPA: DUF1877 family protein [Herpetosiphonaceae bacterium]